MCGGQQWQHPPECLVPFCSTLIVTIGLVVCNLLSFLFGSAIFVIILSITCMQYYFPSVNFCLCQHIWCDRDVGLAWCRLYCISLIESWKSEKLRQHLLNHQTGWEGEANSGNFGALFCRFCSQTKTKIAESTSDVNPYGVHIWATTWAAHKNNRKKKPLLGAKKPR